MSKVSANSFDGSVEEFSDFFKVFGLVRSYKIDKSKLDFDYINMWKNLPCDKQKEINVAYKTIKDDFLRAKYLADFIEYDLKVEDRKKINEFFFKCFESFDILKSDIEKADFIKDINEKVASVISELDADFVTDKYMFKLKVAYLQFFTKFLEKVGKDVYCRD